MLPAAIEMMDNLAIQAAEAAVHANYPNCGALLLVELDGPFAEVESLMKHVDAICRENGASEIRVAQSEAERALVWKGRKAAFAAVGRISPNYIVQDGVIPRTALPQVMSEIDRLSKETGVRVANVFHAGDGNLHPLVLYDRRIAGQEEAAEALSYKILEICIAAEVRSPASTASAKTKNARCRKCSASRTSKRCNACAARSIRMRLANPGKIFPTPRLCGEKPGKYVTARTRIRRNRGALLTMDASASARDSAEVSPRLKTPHAQLSAQRMCAQQRRRSGRGSSAATCRRAWR